MKQHSNTPTSLRKINKMPWKNHVVGFDHVMRCTLKNGQKGKSIASINTSYINGRNQQSVYSIIYELSLGRHVQDIRYYGGTASNGLRCISMGRECTLFYDIPWEIVDLRHGGEIFRQAHVSRLGTNCQRSFNRALHGLIQKKWIIPLQAEFITEKKYSKPDWREKIHMGGHERQRSYLRFVIIVPNAFYTEMKDHISY